MAAADVEQILIVSPRYADDVASAVAVSGFAPLIERRGQVAITRFIASQLKVVVVDARGALEPGLAVAAALGAEVEARRGGLLVLLSRSDHPGSYNSYSINLCSARQLIFENQDYYYLFFLSISFYK